MRADRLLSTLLLLQAHGKLTVRELAARLEVSQRTAHLHQRLPRANVQSLAADPSEGAVRLALPLASGDGAVPVYVDAS